MQQADRLPRQFALGCYRNSSVTTVLLQPAPTHATHRRHQHKHVITPMGVREKPCVELARLRHTWGWKHTGRYVHSKLTSRDSGQVFKTLHSTVNAVHIIQSRPSAFEIPHFLSHGSPQLLLAKHSCAHRRHRCRRRLACRARHRRLAPPHPRANHHQQAALSSPL